MLVPLKYTLEPSALISLGRFAAKKLLVAARGSVQCLCSLARFTSPPPPPAPPSPQVLRKFRLTYLSVVYQGQCTWLPPFFPRDSAQASLGGNSFQISRLDRLDPYRYHSVLRGYVSLQIAHELSHVTENSSPSWC